MKAPAIIALAFMAYAIPTVTPAMAGVSDACSRGWSGHQGVLRGADARRFIDDMNAQGVPVYTSRGGVTVQDYMRACSEDARAQRRNEES